MKKNKVMVLAMSAIALALILAFAGCATVPSGVDVAEAAEQLAAEFNAIIPGIAEVDGVTVTLTNRIWFQWSGDGDAIFMDGRREVSEGLWIKKYHLTVPAGVTLDITADDAGLYLGNNMTLTVNGTVKARSDSLGFEDNASEVTVDGNGTINLNGTGSLFGIIQANHNVTNRKLILDGVTLVGIEDNNEALVQVREGGEFILKSGAITGNSGAWAGGGVAVHDAIFTMEGGMVSGNNAVWSSGVYVTGAGTFIMTGGIISGNTAQESSGGVRLDGGTFIMTGGEISGNRALGVDEWSGGGGVDVCDGASFTMSGGIISGNSVGGSGGGVVIYEGTFTMTGGEISGNTAEGSGGGVVVAWDGTFTMEGGTIYGSSAAGGNANTAQENAAISVAEEATATWGTGGTYTIGGASQNGGSNIASTNDTLIAIPAP